ncbi:MAG: hypothetical protein COB02_03465 [Candidatus Cloacimonadota bacterium]|nr:MAG: hypothetical protein COB02_03465 [Candidatus Cloacimonadota bacterium]
MNSRQLEEEFKKEEDAINKKVHLGELSADEGDFLVKQAKEKSKRRLARLKRPSRTIFFVIALIATLCFLYSFFKLYTELDRLSISHIELYVLVSSVFVFLILGHLELNRLERMFSRFFSKAYLKQILYAPEIDFEWDQRELVQVRLNVKNQINLYAGLLDEEVCELNSNLLSAVTTVFDDGSGLIEEVALGYYVINYRGSHNVELVITKIEKLFSLLRMHDGDWFSKSVRMGASVVSGRLWCGTLGTGFQVYRTMGHKVKTSEALAEATGWEEIYLDEYSLNTIDKIAITSDKEPVFLRSTSELISVHQFITWRGGKSGI